MQYVYFSTLLCCKLKKLLRLTTDGVVSTRTRPSVGQPFYFNIHNTTGFCGHLAVVFAEQPATTAGTGENCSMSS